MTITKADLVDKISRKEPDLTKSTVQKMVNNMIQTITDEVSSGNKVELAKFGSFSSVKRAARSGRNPQNGEVIEIPEKVVPVFRPGKNFKQVVNDTLN